MDSSIRLKLLKRVKAGAELLDGIEPDWWKMIDPALLELSDPYKCVLGQVYGGYENGIYAVFKTSAVEVRMDPDIGMGERVSEYGMDFPDDLFPPTEDYPEPSLMNEIWSLLTESWLAEAKVRANA